MKLKLFIFNYWKNFPSFIAGITEMKFFALNWHFSKNFYGINLILCNIRLWFVID